MSDFMIKKEFHFSASHQLAGLPDDHQCARLHGHNYILTVGLVAPTLNEVGFVLDYGELGFVKDLVDQLDHRHLNDIFPFNPTSELICDFYSTLIGQHIKRLENTDHIDMIEVGLSETPKTWAYVRKWAEDIK